MTITTGRPAPATSHRRGRVRQERLTAAAFLLPALALCVVLLYIPFVYTSYLSLTEFNGLGDPEFVGLDKYEEMFSDARILTSMVNTLIWVVGTLVLPVGLGLFIAVMVHGLRGSFWYRLPFLLPYAISGIAVGVIFSFILQTGGALTQALELFGLPFADARWLLDWPLNTIVMIVAATWQGAGVNALLFSVGLQSIPKEPVEAAMVDGAKGWTMFRHITWPMLAPMTTVVVGLSIVGSLKTFDIVWGMTQGGPGRVSETLAITMYKASFMLNDYGLGAAVALLLTVVTVTASLLYLRRQLAPAKEF
ncbi:carbohydrate ABC transporter permease [Bogoriella caseilytica]|uniref:Carbohydrate ABC transporter membrane protein 1 (CUT1 family) n=1 Tax=Bogoriella caseilytica TaxID=56055 RepID=A0A3N2BGV0_9MICO|nr:sugar ABC transporter permease [Bogoriella caseilytica]ROR74482.1 carbohydrate ABC transporter membrane protein 1 (CUT1 family) [Bogoriella caseilytica]